MVFFSWPAHTQHINIVLSFDFQFQSKRWLRSSGAIKAMKAIKAGAAMVLVKCVDGRCAVRRAIKAQRSACRPFPWATGSAAPPTTLPPVLMELRYQLAHSHLRASSGEQAVVVIRQMDPMLWTHACTWEYDSVSIVRASLGPRCALPAGLGRVGWLAPQRRRAHNRMQTPPSPIP